MPRGYRPSRPHPLVVMLHGAGGNGRNGLAPFLPLADKAGLLLLGPNARRETWDTIYGAFGPDVAIIDRELGDTFDRYTVDPTHVAIEGFSDGASYALSLGITNGDLFTHIIAFSPGFMAPSAQRDHPRVFISHGTHDPTLRVDLSHRLVPRLEAADLDVEFVEFSGGHTVPPEIAAQAVTWFLDDG